MLTKWSMVTPMHRIASTSLSDWEKKSMAILLTRKLSSLSKVLFHHFNSYSSLHHGRDAVLINTPVYPPFARSVKLNRRKLIENSLVGKDGLFQIDFDQLEKKDIVEQEVKLYVLCNRTILEAVYGIVKSLGKKIGHLCQKHGVLLVSDEIHQDLALFGHRHPALTQLIQALKISA